MASLILFRALDSIQMNFKGYLIKKLIVHKTVNRKRSKDQIY